MADLSQPPHDEALERNVIGALLMRGELLKQHPWVLPEHFYTHRHQVIWRGIMKVREEKGADHVNPFTVIGSLGDTRFIPSSGANSCAEDLASMVNGVHTTSHLPANLARLRELATLRAIIGECKTAAISAYEAATPPLEILSALSESVLGISQDAHTSEGSVSPADLADKLEAHFDATTPAGISTGFSGIDRATSRLCPGKLWVLAGRPAMGKTALAVNIAWHVAQTDPVWVASLEMGAVELGLRIMSAEGRIDYARIQQPHELNNDERREEGRARAAYLSNPYFRVSELSAEGITSNLDSIVAQAHKEHRRHGRLGLIVVDYIQLVSVPRFNHRQREAVVSEVARRLKILARELECTVLAVAQVNRQCESRDDKRPVLSDLRESGAVEQDADVAAFVYRDEYYYPPGTDRPDKAHELPKHWFPGCAEVLFRKIRGGRVGTVDLLWQGKHQRFDNVTYGHRDEGRPRYADN